MSDLVERLRRSQANGNILSGNAADEIERLQFEIKTMGELAERSIDAENEEIERLRAALERYELGIRWALGESPEGTPEFPAVTDPPYYRWRTTLRELTGIMPKATEVLRDE